MNKIKFINEISILHPFCDGWYISKEKEAILELLKKNKKFFDFYGIRPYLDFTSGLLDYEFDFKNFIHDSTFLKNNLIEHMSYKNWITSLIKYIYCELGIIVNTVFDCQKGFNYYNLILLSDFDEKYCEIINNDEDVFYKRCYTFLELEELELNNQKLLFEEVRKIVRFRLNKIIGQISYTNKNYKCFYFM